MIFHINCIHNLCHLIEHKKLSSKIIFFCLENRGFTSAAAGNLGRARAPFLDLTFGALQILLDCDRKLELIFSGTVFYALSRGISFKWKIYPYNPPKPFFPNLSIPDRPLGNNGRGGGYLPEERSPFSFCPFKGGKQLDPGSL